MNEIVYDMPEILTPVIRFDPVADISVAAKAVPSKLVYLPAPKTPENVKRRTFILDSMTDKMMRLTSCRPNPTILIMSPPEASPSSYLSLPISDLPGPDVSVRWLTYPGRWLGGAIVLLLLALLIRAFAMGQIRWNVVGQFLTARVIVVGFGWTLLISACALALGIAPRLFADNRLGARLATDHLLENGHTAIAFVGGPPALLSSKERFGVFEESLNGLGVNLNPNFVFFGDYDEYSGVRAIQHFAALDNPPTAIFASADMPVLGILQSCRKLGITVPADLPLVSFDDIRNVDLLDPPLTTVHQSAEEFGRRAVGLLIDHINGAEIPVAAPVAVKLVVRHSVAAPRTKTWKPAGNGSSDNRTPARAQF